MNWRSIIGQELQCNMLKASLGRGRSAHAYLFVGPSGVGKMTAAKAFTGTLICEDPGEELEACGKCASCRRLMSGNHPDVVCIESNENRIKIDRIRELKEKAAYPPYLAHFQIYIIDGAERMTEEAANALLKLLEEPPYYVKFILTAEGLDGVLPTIRSRSQVIKFSRIPADEISGFLISRKGIDSADARMISRLSEGSLGRAIMISESGELKEMRDWTSKLLIRIEDEGMPAVPDSSDTIERIKERVDSFLEMAEIWYRDILLYKVTGEKELVINLDLIDVICRRSGMSSAKELIEKIGIVNRTKESLKTNSSFRLTIDVMLSELCRAGVD